MFSIGFWLGKWLTTCCKYCTWRPWLGRVYHSTCTHDPVTPCYCTRPHPLPRTVTLLSHWSHSKLLMTNPNDPTRSPTTRLIAKTFHKHILHIITYTHQIRLEGKQNMGLVSLTWFDEDKPWSCCDACVWLWEGRVKSVNSNSEPCVSAPIRSASSVSRNVSVCELGPYASTLIFPWYSDIEWN